MKKIHYGFIVVLLTALLSGCSVAQWVSEEEVRVDPKSGEVTNKTEVSIEEREDVEVSNSSIRDMNKKDSTGYYRQSENGYEDEFDEESSDLIDDKGYLYGHISNLSDEPLRVAIYRKRTSGKDKKTFSKMIAPMKVERTSLPIGRYVAYIGPQNYCWEFTVRKDERGDYEVSVYDKSTGQEYIETFRGFWFLYNHEYTRLVVDADY